MRHQNKLFLFLLLLFVSGQVYAQPDSAKPINFKDQQILDDLIVDGSACIGQDCVNGESFGFKTLRLKENNLRIHFLDTSTSASFPSADWCIQINDTSNGGGNYYGIVHENTGRRIMSLEANAPQHSLYVDDAGRVGFGTSNPVVELHVVDGNTPTLRLEQDGSSGFAAQTWDVAGNEAGFFIRDVNAGSSLPFRILPGASSQAFVIAGNDEIGIGAGTNPAAKFHIENTGGQDTDDFVVTSAGRIGVGTTAPDYALDLTGELVADRLRVRRASDMNETSLYVGGIEQVTGGFDLQMFNTGGNRGHVFYANPGAGAVAVTRIDANGNISTLGSVTAPAGSIPSDKRLKNNINSFDKGLKEVLKLNPITYNYKASSGFKSTRLHVGLAAQELQKFVPELVSEHIGGIEYTDGTGFMNQQENFLKIHDEIEYLLINAIKDQNAIVENQSIRIDELQLENEELRSLVLELKDAVDKLVVSEVNLDGSDQAFLGQNIPNPFDTDTQISYSIPANSGSASIMIMNLKGQKIKEINISEFGKGVLKIRADELPTGAYTYSLLVDGSVISTQKMILQR